jgi:hypothetical protein
MGRRGKAAANKDAFFFAFLRLLWHFLCRPKNPPTKMNPPTQPNTIPKGFGIWMMRAKNAKMDGWKKEKTTRKANEEMEKWTNELKTMVFLDGPKNKQMRRLRSGKDPIQRLASGCPLGGELDSWFLIVPNSSNRL